MKTLVWITNSFRLDSRLTSKLEGSCTFVYYSPYYFAGDRERRMYEQCSTENLNAFYQSINDFDSDLKSKNNRLHIFKNSDPIEHINYLAQKYNFDRLVIDQPLFAMWHTVDLIKLNIPYDIIDSALVDDNCFNMTAKSRWQFHARNISNFQKNSWNSNIVGYSIDEPTFSYPKRECHSQLMDSSYVNQRSKNIAPTYGLTRDNHNGQTRSSVATHNGIVDPANLFFDIAKNFLNEGADLTVNEGAHAAMLRQFAFREINIIRARRNNLTLEDNPLEWAKVNMTKANYEHLISAQPKPDSTLTLEKIKTANTGIPELDKILEPFIVSGYMPNRARMYFAGKVFYESKSGLDALNLLIDTFDLIGLDGQSPNNYMQCVSSLGLQYGKVMLLNSNRVFELLQYDNC
jgi:deoxyribodipyrimidine photolyase